MVETEELRKEIWKELGGVMDPEIGLSITDLGLVYDVLIEEENKAHVTMTFTSMGCPYGPQLQAEAQLAASKPEQIEDAYVEVVFSPPWDPHTMASEDAKETLGIF